MNRFSHNRKFFIAIVLTATTFSLAAVPKLARIVTEQNLRESEAELNPLLKGSTGLSLDTRSCRRTRVIDFLSSLTLAAVFKYRAETFRHPLGFSVSHSFFKGHRLANGLLAPMRH